jgi:hypothetical protein
LGGSEGVVEEFCELEFTFDWVGFHELEDLARAD